MKSRQGSSNQGINQGTDQGSINQGSRNQGSSNQGINQVTGQGSINQGSIDQGSSASKATTRMPAARPAAAQDFACSWISTR